MRKSNIPELLSSIDFELKQMDEYVFNWMSDKNHNPTLEDLVRIIPNLHQIANYQSLLNDILIQRSSKKSGLFALAVGVSSMFFLWRAHLKLLRCAEQAIRLADASFGEAFTEGWNSALENREAVLKAYEIMSIDMYGEE